MPGSNVRSASVQSFRVGREYQFTRVRRHKTGHDPARESTTSSRPRTSTEPGSQRVTATRRPSPPRTLIITHKFCDAGDGAPTVRVMPAWANGPGKGQHEDWRAEGPIQFCGRTCPVESGLQPLMVPDKVPGPLAQAGMRTGLWPCQRRRLMRNNEPGDSNVRPALIQNSLVFTPVSVDRTSHHDAQRVSLKKHRKVDVDPFRQS